MTTKTGQTFNPIFMRLYLPERADERLSYILFNETRFTIIILCVPKYVSLWVHAHDDTFVLIAEDSASTRKEKSFVQRCWIHGVKKDIIIIIFFLPL